MAVDAAKELEGNGKKVRVVSLPSWELFEEQDQVLLTLHPAHTLPSLPPLLPPFPCVADFLRAVRCQYAILPRPAILARIFSVLKDIALQLRSNYNTAIHQLCHFECHEQLRLRTLSVACRPCQHMCDMSAVVQGQRATP